MFFATVQNKLHYAVPKNMPRQNLRSTVSYKIVCSKATLTGIWVNYLYRRNEEKAVLLRVGDDMNGYWEVLLDIRNVV